MELMRFLWVQRRQVRLQDTPPGYGEGEEALTTERREVGGRSPQCLLLGGCSILPFVDLKRPHVS